MSDLGSLRVKALKLFAALDLYNKVLSNEKNCSKMIRTKL